MHGIDIIPASSFDDLTTGELDTHATRIAATPHTPDPVPASAAIGYGEPPRIQPRHMRLHRPLTAFGAFMSLVVISVLADTVLIVWLLAGLEMIGAMR